MIQGAITPGARYAWAGRHWTAIGTEGDGGVGTMVLLRLIGSDGGVFRLPLTIFRGNAFLAPVTAKECAA